VGLTNAEEKIGKKAKQPNTLVDRGSFKDNRQRLCVRADGRGDPRENAVPVFKKK
jgi:hypothetical protein